MGTKEGLMALLRTAVVAAGIAVAMNAAAFAEDPGASTSPSQRCRRTIPARTT